MSKAKATSRLAILGAGPIGLEAGIYAKSLDIPFTLYERGRVAEYWQRWGHVRLFTPYSANTTPLGRQEIARHKPPQEVPADDALLTGKEHLANYLRPLAELLQANIQYDAYAVFACRKGIYKQEMLGDGERAKTPFRLFLRDAKGKERFEEADVILDCTGTYGHHRWLGSGGIPAMGEMQAEPNIAYTLDDVLGERRNHYANKNILVVGAGYSAATTVCDLAKLAEETTSTWIYWTARGTSSLPIKRLTNDPFKDRDRLAVRANTIATRTDASVEFFGGTTIEVVEFQGQDRGFKVTGRTGGKNRTWEVDRILANIGYTPDRLIYRELQIAECPATFASLKLKQPEPNYYILGAKSFGRNPSFLLKNGFEQVRDVFRLITESGDLDLYKKK